MLQVEDSSEETPEAALGDALVGADAATVGDSDNSASGEAAVTPF